MDFSDILSYPSPSNNVIHQVTSSDLHTCERYLQTCARLVNILSDREIDIRSVHYKYRLERFLKSRSKTSRRFISTYESRFPELAIPKNQLFIYEPNGNVSIDTSQPTAISKKHPPINKNPILSSSIVEEKPSVPDSKCTIPVHHTDLTCWSVVKYVPRVSLLPLIEESIFKNTPIRLPWIVKRVKVPSVECDLRPLFIEKQQLPSEPFDLRPLFRVEQRLAVECDISPLFNEHLTYGDIYPPADLNNEELRVFWNLLLLLIISYIIVTTACGIELSLLCYASVGVLIYSITWFGFGFLFYDDHMH